MRNRINNNKGFTLIELIMVIVILGILAAVAIPKYYDLQNEAKAASEKGSVAGIRAGVHTYFAQNKAFPATLDGASVGACSPTNICFATVLDQGAVQTSDWNKDTATKYTGPGGTQYTYTAASGTFL